MKLRGFAALGALGGAIALAGWGAFGLAGFDFDAPDGEPGGVSAAAKGPSLAMRATAAMEADAALPVADAAVVDPSLLSPHPMLVPNGPPLRLAAWSTPEPAQPPDTGVTASIRPAPSFPEMKRSIVEPRLEKDGTLNVAQIARIKASLQLSPDQERHWAPVEAELNEIARQLAAQKASGKPKVALSADAAQRLYWAAGPLIMSLREDQKQEVRRLARAMGLEQVASLI